MDTSFSRSPDGLLLDDKRHRSVFDGSSGEPYDSVNTYFLKNLGCGIEITGYSRKWMIIQIFEQVIFQGSDSSLDNRVFIGFMGFTHN
jgi:hypothetical protein